MIFTRIGLTGPLSAGPFLAKAFNSNGANTNGIPMVPNVGAMVCVGSC